MFSGSREILNGQMLPHLNSSGTLTTRLPDGFWAEKLTQHCDNTDENLTKSTALLTDLAS